MQKRHESVNGDICKVIAIQFNKLLGSEEIRHGMSNDVDATGEFSKATCRERIVVTVTNKYVTVNRRSFIIDFFK